MSVRSARLVIFALAALATLPAAASDRDKRHGGYFYGESNSGVIIYYGSGHGGYGGYGDHYRPSNDHRHRDRYGYRQGYRDGYRDGFRDNHYRGPGNIASYRHQHRERRGGRVVLPD